MLVQFTTSAAACVVEIKKTCSAIKMQLKFPHSFKAFSFFLSFTVLLMLASQRIESVMDFSGESSYDEDLPTKRGAAPTLIELFILSWVSGKFSHRLV